MIEDFLAELRQFVNGDSSRSRKLAGHRGVRSIRADSAHVGATLAVATLLLVPTVTNAAASAAGGAERVQPRPAHVMAAADTAYYALNDAVMPDQYNPNRDMSAFDLEAVVDYVRGIAFIPVNEETDAEIEAFLSTYDRMKTSSPL